VLAYPTTSINRNIRKTEPIFQHRHADPMAIPSLTISDFGAFLSDEDAYRISARGDMQVGE
jgi:hypothetical protein